jgi:hypothetical protein
MHAATVVALISAILAAIIAVSVPQATFRLALRQDQARWLREQRAQLYIDLLTEAHAESQYLEYELAEDAVRERMRAHFTDLRLPPLERARLGARSTIYASRTVNMLFNRLEGQALAATLRKRDEASRVIARLQVGGTLDDLQDAIRRELGADRILLDAGPAATASGPQKPAAPSGANSAEPGQTG